MESQKREERALLGKEIDAVEDSLTPRLSDEADNIVLRLSGSPEVNAHAPNAESTVRSLVGELIIHMLHSMGKKL